MPMIVFPAKLSLDELSFIIMSFSHIALTILMRLDDETSYWLGNSLQEKERRWISKLYLFPMSDFTNINVRHQSPQIFHDV